MPDTLQDRRFDPRRRSMIPALLDGHPVVVVDLSLGGIGAGAFEILTEDDLAVSAGQAAQLTIPRDGPLAQRLDVLVVRTNEAEGRFAARFIGLNEGQLELVRDLIERPAEVLRTG